jgi:hypothetical protein
MREHSHERGHLIAEAELIYRRSRAVRVPKGFIAPFVMGDYGPSELRFIRVPEGHPRERFFRVLDMSTPWSESDYDKKGNRLMVEAMRDVLFGGARLAKQRVEAFFNGPANFLGEKPHAVRTTESRKPMPKRWKIRLGGREGGEE